MKKMFVSFLCLGLLVACDPEPKLLELNSEQILKVGLENYKQGVLRQSGTGLYSETCDDKSFVNSALVYDLQLEPNKDYNLDFFSSSMTCQNNSINLDAKLYLFENGELKTQSETNDSHRTEFTFRTNDSGANQLAIVPKFQDDEAGFSLRIDVSD